MPIDTSEQYIKMCDNKKIQDSLPKEDDFYICFIQHGKYYIQMQPRKKIIRYPGRYRKIKLPTQGQIKEMIKPRSRLYFLLKDIQVFQVKHTTSIGIETMEQLWLAFYMYEKHSKVWSGEKWVRKK